MNGYEQLIAILVIRLGGDVTITDQELSDSTLELEITKHPAMFAYRLRTTREPDPAEIVAQIIASAVPLDEYFAERRALEPVPVVPHERVVNRDELTFHHEPHPELPGVVVPVMDQQVRMDPATGAIVDLPIERTYE